MLYRVDNWNVTLSTFATEVSGLPWEWGETDCASLVREALRRVYGFDLWEGEVKSWATPREAVETLSRIDRDLPSAFLRTGAREIGRNWVRGGHVGFGGFDSGTDLPQLGVRVPGRLVLTSSEGGEVRVVRATEVTDNARWFSWDVAQRGIV